MITRHICNFPKDHNASPRVRVAMNKVTMLEMTYTWEGVSGTVPELSMDLSSDPSHEKVFLAAVYRKGDQRRVVVDSRALDMSQGGAALAASSADSALAAEGWDRLFLIFQVFVPAGLMGSAEDENTTTQVFEYTSGA